MNTTKPSKNNVLFEALFFILCIFFFLGAVVTVFGILPGDAYSLVILIGPAILGVASFARLWLAWCGKPLSFPLLAFLIAAVSALSALLWRLSGLPFGRYDFVYLLLPLLFIAMDGVLRFNKAPFQPGNDDRSSTS